MESVDSLRFSSRTASARNCCDEEFKLTGLLFNATNSPSMFSNVSLKRNLMLLPLFDFVDLLDLSDILWFIFSSCSFGLFNFRANWEVSLMVEGSAQE
jgi:hypothetical protein